MRSWTHTRFFVASLVVVTGCLSAMAPAYAERPATDRVSMEGAAPEGRWTAGFRPGFSLNTQEVIENTSSGIGPVLNFQALYGLNRWISVGLTFEWERRSIDQQQPRVDLGSLNTISILPTVEFRPVRYGALVPYASAAIGVNVNSFSEDTNVPSISPSNTFAFRLAGGMDYFLNSRLALNTELAWKRNRGGVDIAGAENNFDASSMNFLFGVRYTFQ